MFHVQFIAALHRLLWRDEVVTMCCGEHIQQGQSGVTCPITAEMCREACVQML